MSLSSLRLPNVSSCLRVSTSTEVGGKNMIQSLMVSCIHMFYMQSFTSSELTFIVYTDLRWFDPLHNWWHKIEDLSSLCFEISTHVTLTLALIFDHQNSPCKYYGQIGNYPFRKHPITANIWRIFLLSNYLWADLEVELYSSVVLPTEDISI